MYGETGGVVVLPQRCAPLSPGSIPALYVHLVSSTYLLHRFSLASPVFLLHLKMGFLKKSVSGIIWSYSARADWQLIWHCALSSSGDMSCVIKIQIYLFYLLVAVYVVLPLGLYPSFVPFLSLERVK